MPTNRAILADVLPVPTAPCWGVSLALENGSSDKEYRIAVDGVTTLFQWGRFGADGQSNKIVHPDATTAAATARKQWAAKEAKGYWPTTGLMPLMSLREYRFRIELMDAALTWASRLPDTKPGDELWLCQVPDFRRQDSAAALTNLAHASGLLSSDAALKSGGFCLVSADATSAAILQAACPVAVRAGSRSDANTDAVAQIAHTLWCDKADGELARVALGRALDTARLLLA